MLIVCQNPVKEILTPSPNGLITHFFTSQIYKPNTVTVWLNGIKLIADWADGFAETGDTEITMKVAPLIGDSLQVEYEPL